MNSNHIKNQIPLLYRKNFFDITLWAWVERHRYGRTDNKGIVEAVRDFKEYFNLSEDEAGEDSLQRNYQKTRREFMKLRKKENPVLEGAKVALDN